MSKVLVSVITSVYNCEKYMEEMIYSILAQSMDEWEWILIDDASDDGTWEIIQRFEDSRIIKIHNEQNVGLTHNLNQAISISRGKYIIRMDGDDIAYSQRFEKQVKYMEENPEVVLSGSWMQAFGIKHDVYRSVSNDDVLKINLLFNSVIFHPTFIIRSAILRQHNVFYNEMLAYAQDYDLAFRLSKYGKLANIQEVLMKYRTHDAQISSNKREMQKKCADVTRTAILNNLGIHLNDESLQYWTRFCLLDYHELDVKEKEVLQEIQEELLNENRMKQFYPVGMFESILKNRLAGYIEQCEKAIKMDLSKNVTDKYLVLFNMTNQWLRLKQKGKNVAIYFERKSINAIAIYGMSYVGEALVEELKESNISIKYGIDKMAGCVYADFKLVLPEDKLEEVDAVVVTSVTYFDEIKEMLRGKLDCPVISLEDILYEV